MECIFLYSGLVGVGLVRSLRTALDPLDLDIFRGRNLHMWHLSIRQSLRHDLLNKRNKELTLRCVDVFLVYMEGSRLCQ